MDKTISISLGGYSFIVDDAAYLKLKRYLDEVRRSLNGMEGTDDVISDVEIRIAELFKERLGSREVVSDQDVDYVIQIMGKPEQYVDADDTETGGTGKGTGTGFTPGVTATGKKKLYRDPDDKVLGGVLSGIAHYIGVESWITRVIWILLFFADIPLTGTSFTIVAYIILWIILPKAVTISQKYEMFGETGDIESIRKNVGAATESGRKGHQLSDSFAEALKIFGRIILIFIGFIFICIGLSLVFTAIFTMIVTAGDIPVQVFGRFFDYPWQDTTAKIIILIALGVPGMLLTYLGARMISNRVKINRILVFSSVGIWFAALLLGGILTASAFKSFSRSAEFTEKKSFTTNNDTITLGFNEFKQINKKKIKWDFDFDSDIFAKMDGKLYRKIDRSIEVRQSPNDQFSVNVVYTSHGSSVENARQNAESINYNYIMNSKGELIFDNYVELPQGAKFRNQDISLIVYVPEGKVIHSTNVKNLIFSDDDSFSKNTQRGSNKFYKFVGEQFECLNCSNDSTQFDEDDDDSARVIIKPGSIKVHDGNDKIEISTKKIKITDGTDTINIGSSGN